MALFIQPIFQDPIKCHNFKLIDRLRTPFAAAVKVNLIGGLIARVREKGKWGILG